jgi:hypothetical protein
MTFLSADRWLKDRKIPNVVRKAGFLDRLYVLDQAKRGREIRKKMVMRIAGMKP